MWPFKLNDWKEVFTSRQEFRGSITGLYNVIFILKYSPSRKKYKITWTGDYHPSMFGFPAYKECLDKKIELEKNLK